MARPRETRGANDARRNEVLHACHAAQIRGEYGYALTEDQVSDLVEKLEEIDKPNGLDVVAICQQIDARSAGGGPVTNDIGDLFLRVHASVRSPRTPPPEEPTNHESRGTTDEDPT